MCQNTFIDRSEQIDRCVENGMPEKIVDSLIYAIKKRIKREEKISKRKDETQTIKTNMEQTNLVDSNLKPYQQQQQQKPQQQINSSTAISTPTSTKFSYASHNPLEELIKPAVVLPLESEKKSFQIPKMCGRFQQQLNKNQSSKNQIEKRGEQVYTDVLAVGTAYTKVFFEEICNFVGNFRETKTFTLLTRTTQPAHFIAICILTAVLFAIWPDLIDRRTNSTTSGAKKASTESNAFAAIVYLAALGTHFGAQIWMTFISGLSLYFSLPRHIFGQCQQILFPKYFAFNAVLSIILLLTFVKYFMHDWTLAIIVQFTTLVMNPTIELTVRLYLAPPMLRLMHEKYKIENAVGSGKEIGSLVQGDLTQCPHYQRIHKAFRRLHMIIAIGNMLTLLATCLQIYFLASKIQINVC